VSDRRNLLSKPVDYREPPGLLRRGPQAWVPYLPDTFDHGPMDLRSIMAARTVRSVARFAWFTATGFAGGQDWRSPPAECPKALKAAGLKLAEDLLRAS
jgi:hypothetical protein